MKKLITLFFLILLSGCTAILPEKEGEVKTVTYEQLFSYDGVQFYEPKVKIKIGVIEFEPGVRLGSEEIVLDLYSLGELVHSKGITVKNIGNDVWEILHTEENKNPVSRGFLGPY